MHTHQLKQPLTTPVSGDYADYIYSTTWIVYNKHSTATQIIFQPNGLLLIYHDDKQDIEFWKDLGSSRFTMTWGNATHPLLLVRMDYTLLVFRLTGTDEYLLLFHPEFQLFNDIYTITQVNRYLFRPDDDFYIMPSFNTDTNPHTPPQCEGPSEESSLYPGFTDEEIVYDYLQRQQEEQDEEDYYLQQMNND